MTNTQGVVALRRRRQRRRASSSSSARPTSSPAASSSRTRPTTLAKLVAAKGDETRVESRKAELDDLKITLKENIELGRRRAHRGRRRRDRSTATSTSRAAAASTACSSSSPAATPELAHDIAVHIAFARPKYLTRDDVPADVVDAERATLETISRNEGKPEAALPEDRRGPPAAASSRTSPCSTSPTPRTTSSRSPSCSATPRSSASPRSRSAEPRERPIGRRARPSVALEAHRLQAVG